MFRYLDNVKCKIFDATYKGANWGAKCEAQTVGAQSVGAVSVEAQSGCNLLTQLYASIYYNYFGL